MSSNKTPKSSILSSQSTIFLFTYQTYNQDSLSPKLRSVFQLTSPQKLSHTLESLDSPIIKKKLFSKSFIPITQIGKGAFGKIYKVSPKDDPSQFFAAKVAPLSKSAGDAFQDTDLKKEAQILHDLRLQPGFPKLNSYHIESKYEILIMELLGENLNTLHRQCGGRFSVKTLVLLGLQILRRIEALHEKGILHRDLKPENIVMGSKERGDESIVYLIDFGLSALYLDKHGKHAPFNKKAKGAGTLYYLSVYGHLGIEASRRDDLISLVYMLVHLFKGGLPWLNLTGDLKEKVKMIAYLKSTMDAESLCEGLPREFCEYFKCVLGLQYFQKPNYEYLRGLLEKVLQEIDAKEDGHFDWMLTENKGIDLKGLKIPMESLNMYIKNLDDDEETLVDL